MCQGKLVLLLATLKSTGQAECIVLGECPPLGPVDILLWDLCIACMWLSHPLLFLLFKLQNKIQIKKSTGIGANCSVQFGRLGDSPLLYDCSFVNEFKVKSSLKEHESKFCCNGGKFQGGHCNYFILPNPCTFHVQMEEIKCRVHSVEADVVRQCLVKVVWRTNCQAMIMYLHT